MQSQVPLIISGSPDVTLTEPGLLWDKFHIFQGHKRNTPFIQIGKRRRSRRLKVAKHPNPLKQALAFQELLDTGHAGSQVELSKLCGTPRSTIAAYLRLLNLDEQVQHSLLEISNTDQRLHRLTESRLRGLVGQDAGFQRRRLEELLTRSETAKPPKAARA